MQINKAEYTQMPQNVEVFSNTDLIIRKDIKQEERINLENETPYTVYTCDEIQVRMNEDIPKEQIESNLDFWWNYYLQQEKDKNAAKLTYEFQDAHGEYMGTGCYGENNPNILSLNFTPTFLSISDENGNLILYNGQLKNDNLIFQNIVNGIQWYSPIGPINQFNEMNKKYYYNAFGKIQI